MSSQKKRFSILAFLFAASIGLDSFGSSSIIDGGEVACTKKEKINPSCFPPQLYTRILDEQVSEDVYMTATQAGHLVKLEDLKEGDMVLSHVELGLHFFARLKQITHYEPNVETGYVVVHTQEGKIAATADHFIPVSYQSEKRSVRMNEVRRGRHFVRTSEGVAAVTKVAQMTADEKAVYGFKGKIDFITVADRIMVQMDENSKPFMLNTHASIDAPNFLRLVHAVRSLYGSTRRSPTNVETMVQDAFLASASMVKAGTLSCMRRCRKALQID